MSLHVTRGLWQTPARSSQAAACRAPNNVARPGLCFETIPLLIVVAFWYLAVVSIMSIGQHYLERYFGRSDKRIDPVMMNMIRRAFGWRRPGAAG